MVTVRDLRFVKNAAQKRAYLHGAGESAGVRGIRRMTRKKRRLMVLLLAGLGLGSATALTLTAFQDNLVFFLSPSDIAARQPGGEARRDRLLCHPGRRDRRGAAQRAACRRQHA